MKTKNQLAVISIFIFGFISLPAHSTKNIHSISVKSGTGTVITNDSTLDTKLSEQYGLVYEFLLNSHYAINAEYLEGSYTCFIVCFTNDFRSAEWKSQQVTVKGFTPFTKRWSVFARLGINYSTNRFITSNYDPNSPYSSDVLLPDRKASGFNYVVALGIEFKAANGFRFGFDAQHLPMPLFDANIYSVFVGYSF